MKKTLLSLMLACSACFGATNSFDNVKVKSSLYWSTNTLTQQSFLTPDGTVVVGTNNWDNSMVYGNYGVYLNGRDLLIESEDLTGGFVLKPVGSSFNFYTEGGVQVPSAVTNSVSPQYAFTTNYPYGTPISASLGNGGMGFYEFGRRVVFFAPNRLGSQFSSIPMISLGTNTTIIMGSYTDTNINQMIRSPDDSYLGTWSTNVTLSWSPIAITASQTQVISFQGVTTNDVAYCGWPAGLESTITTWVGCSNNAVIVRYFNIGAAGGVTPATGRHRIKVDRHTPPN